MRTKSRMELVFMYKALEHLGRAKAEMSGANEILFASRINGLIMELEHELEKWEVLATDKAYAK
jgi:hypothetical protein